ncbi:nucleotidyltransferase [Bacillus sp. DX1.1]|uniref:nucleotidyltransferase n=1 Tax=unclassified Bacillus (in: firmicutes) TaxID=185979 RepID=UPI00256FBFAB|nr:MULTISPECIES: nucleotidyltransferase [unclassified Bacillus (in: firmicutes)]MDM5154905.1 nucleotidyltransferase [Bacillus sp. DX1.1]WJE83776.1 nucleotidyltransferase [Bacillus sp. DX3.1]
MKVIKKIGRFCSVDHDGYMINDSHMNKVQPAFFEVIQEVKDTCIRLLKNDLHSIYIRGSIPRGIGIEGIADIDTIVLVGKDPKVIDLGGRENIEKEILRNFHCVSGVEFSFYHVEDVLDSTNFLFVSFMIQTHSICIFGEDVRYQLPKYKVSIELANEHLIHLQKQIEQAREELIHHNGSDDIQDCCRWIMKIIVRAGLALTIDREALYSRDLYPAYELFSKHFPDQEQQMRKALQYAIAPSENAQEILAFLDGFGDWIMKESDQWLTTNNFS